MSTTNTTRPREVENHIVRTIRKLNEPQLTQILQQLHDMTRSPAPGARP
ncbi:MAG: hypothetical protein K9L82_06460 [Chromatiaceae bacterium]|nr:hypothetical protein [Chromatiaceae bacterium]MCF7993851.1 hypothetical protein [Chromatiaceae bacterium]MCF8003871.1 hypothetical protein [Chromatiaceae bacterium]MCF8017144.1 hypothetical protein [Chromatiaceae bacterium]